MPRANRHYVPGHIWHITHRCHGREFLLDKERDRLAWLSWLRLAQERYRFPVLGYAVTSNHIHLLVQDPGVRQALPRGMQLLQGQTAQEYNHRTGRINAFWGDRYHATAVEHGSHLLRCIVYIDLNMVRAGVVKRPERWRESGFHELHDEGARSGIIDKSRLAALLGCPDCESLRRKHLQAIEDGLQRDALNRDERWSESVAVGSRTFVDNFALSLGDRIGARSVSAGESDDSFLLREPVTSSYGETTTVSLEGDNTFEYGPEIDPVACDPDSPESDPEVDKGYT